MANFQFIEAAGKGYKFVWDERGFLIRLVALPLLIKIASFMLVVSLGLQDNLLRQGLILIPSYFMEGWVVAHAIRLAIFGEIGPLHDVHNRNIIMATSILYALIKLSSSLVAGMMMTGEDVKQSINASQIDANAGIVFGVAFMLAFALWAFRFLPAPYLPEKNSRLRRVVSHARPLGDHRHSADHDVAGPGGYPNRDFPRLYVREALYGLYVRARHAASRH